MIWIARPPLHRGSRPRSVLPAPHNLQATCDIAAYCTRHVVVCDDTPPLLTNEPSHRGHIDRRFASNPRDFVRSIRSLLHGPASPSLRSSSQEQRSHSLGRQPNGLVATRVNSGVYNHTPLDEYRDRHTVRTNADKTMHKILVFSLDELSSPTLSIPLNRRTLVHEAPASWNGMETCGSAKWGDRK